MINASYIAGMHYGRDSLLVRIRTSGTPRYVETGAANKIYVQIIRVHTQLFALQLNLLGFFLFFFFLLLFWL